MYHIRPQNRVILITGPLVNCLKNGTVTILILGPQVNCPQNGLATTKIVGHQSNWKVWIFSIFSFFVPRRELKKKTVQ